MLRRIVFLGCGAILPLTLLAQPGSDQQLIKEAQVLLNSRKEGEALALYEKAIAREPDHFEVLCEAVELKTKIAFRTKDLDLRKAHLQTARTYAEKAYLLRPNDAHANYILALGRGGVAFVGSPKEKLRGAYELKKYLDKALNLNPKHAAAWYLLSKWNEAIADLNFAEVAAARLLYNGVPPGASVDNAVECMKKAVACDADNILYIFELARLYDELEEEEEVIRLLEKAMTLKVATSDELEVRKRCKTLWDAYQD